MSLNIGTLVGYLQLDDANFARKADNADRKINALKLHLEALGRENPKIGVEVTAQTAELDLLKVKLADLKVQAESGVDVRVGAVQALIELDRVQTKIRELHGKTVNVKVDVDKSQLSEATSAIDGIGSKLGVLPALAVAGTSALIPLVGVLGGLGAALGAPLLLAAGGATVFGFLAAFAAKDTEAKLKAIEKLRQHLGTLTKGTKEYAQAQQQLKDAEKALTPEQRKFAAAQDSLTGAFQKFLAGKGGQSLLDVMAQGMGVLSHLLPVISPLIVAVGGGFSTLLSDLDRADRGQGLEHFIGQLSRLVGPDIVAAGHILINLASGVGSLLLVLAHSHLSHEVVSGLVELTQNFDKWSSSSAARHDVRDLFAYVHKVGPQVGSTLGAIARAAGHLVQALAPLGPPVLKVVEGIANAISSIPVPVLTALAGAFLALTAVQKVGGFKALGALGSLGGGGPLGVQKVFVVNPGFGDASEGGFLGKYLKLLPQAAILIAAGYEAYKASRGIEHNLSQAPKGFGIGAPTLGSSATPSGAHINYGKLAMEANGYFTSTTNHWDAVKAHAGEASRQIDQIGPHAAAAFGAADRDVDVFRAKLASIQDKRLTVILQDQAAIQALEALQNLRLKDKYLTVYQRSRTIDQAVGPGGGIGQRHAGGGEIRGAGSGVSDSVRILASNGEYMIRAAQYAANGPLVRAINNGSGRVSLASAASAHGSPAHQGSAGRVALTITNWADGTGYIEEIATETHAADHRYAAAVGRN